MICKFFVIKMSILLGKEISKEFEAGRIHIEPFHPKQLGPNSYDVRLFNALAVYDFDEIEYLDCRKENPVRYLEIPAKEGFILQPGQLYLGATMEAVGSDFFVPMYEGRSSMARLGIQSHISAGFGDIGFKSQWTLEISVVHPVKIYAEMRIGQVYFHRVNLDLSPKLYDGKYKNQKGPQKSKAFVDFSK